MVRAHEITRPSRTRLAAWIRFAGVIRLSVPRSSSGPQRPQLLSEWYQARISASVGIVRAAVTDDQLTGRGGCFDMRLRPAATMPRLFGGLEPLGVQDAVGGGNPNDGHTYAIGQGRLAAGGHAHHGHRLVRRGIHR